MSNSTTPIQTSPSNRVPRREQVTIVILLITTIVFLFSTVFLLIFSGFSDIPAAITNNVTRNRTLSLIKSDYIGDYPSEKQLQEGEIKGIVSSLKDPYSEYLTADEMKEFRESLNEKYQGIGIRFNEKGGSFIITSVIPNSPAKEANLQEGDILFSINDESIQNLSLDQVAAKIKGESGTSLTLSVLRGTEKINFDLVRREIKSDLATLEIQGTTAIISISSFGEDLDSQLKLLATEITNNKSLQSIVIDLRNNTGGILSEAVNVASYFLSPNTVVVKEKSKTEELVERSTTRTPSLQNYPLAIVVNEFSASASEILAASLRDNRQIMIFGSKTYGKGVVQKLFVLPDGGTLKLTIAEWITPNGSAINKKGIEPDVTISKNDDPLKVAISRVSSTSP